MDDGFLLMLLRGFVISVLALADMLLAISCILVLPLIGVLILSDDGKFPLSIYAWKQMK